MNDESTCLMRHTAITLVVYAAIVTSGPGVSADYDLAIIGGGLNGVSIARDAAGRGLRVILLEQGDLGAGASSASPRLIHGDLAGAGAPAFSARPFGARRARRLARISAASGAPDALCHPRAFRRASAVAVALMAVALRPAGLAQRVCRPRRPSTSPTIRSATR